jgi:hypothetical protein
MDNIFAALLAGLFVSAGWVVNGRMERKKRRSDENIKYRVDAYLIIEDSSNRNELTEIQKYNFERAFATVQLLGSENEVRLLNKFADEFSMRISGERPSSNAMLLLQELRDNLRNELELETLIDKRIRHIRF